MMGINDDNDGDGDSDGMTTTVIMETERSSP